MDVVKMLGAKDNVQAITHHRSDCPRRRADLTPERPVHRLHRLMNFGGDEIYFKQEPNLSGKTYGEALLAFETSTLMGS